MIFVHTEKKRNKEKGNAKTVLPSFFVIDIVKNKRATVWYTVALYEIRRPLEHILIITQPNRIVNT